MPSIERYLCLGGVEVANPARTLAYMAELGNPCMPTPPDTSGCCACEGWLPEVTCPDDLMMDAGLDTEGDGPPQGGVWAITPGSGWQLVGVALASQDTPVGDCTEPPTGPVQFEPFIDLGPFDLPLAGPIADECALILQIYRDANGCEVELALFSSVNADIALSFDRGLTWLVNPTRALRPITPRAAGGFSTPAEDDAPWYDPAVPESADVLGVWIEEARLGVPWARDARARRRGSSLGPGRIQGREVTLSGWLYTRSAAATAYGRQWLFEALAGASGCDGCDLPDGIIWTHCTAADPTGGRRTLKRVGLTGWNPDIEPEFPQACGFKFEATLVAEVGEIFLDPTTVLATDLAVGPRVCNICAPCPAPPAAPCACGQSNPPRVTTQPDLASLYCEPIEVYRVQADLAAPTYWRDATAIIRVQGGADGLKNARIRGWVNPAGLTDPAYFACQDPCLDIEIGCVPPGAELIIDGTTRRATVTCDGMAQNGYAYLSSGGRRFSWPDVSCHGLLVVVDSDAFNTSDDAAVEILFVERERG